MINKKMGNIFKYILWLLQGIIVGFSAIMPGISGGTLCVAFGMYLPVIKVLSHPIKNISAYGKMLFFFGVGGIVGFVGLSGFAGRLMDINSTLVTCAFAGFVIGTFSELWSDAGRYGRNKMSYFGMILAFVIALSLLFVLKNHSPLKIEANALGFLFCGILWGLSLIVPGLSSSSLLLFLDLYQPMLDGIAEFNFKTVIPLAIGIAACILLLSKCINSIYRRKYSQASHIIIGIVAATAIMIIPDWQMLKGNLLGSVLCIMSGAVASYVFTRICAEVKSNLKAQDEDNNIIEQDER